MKSLRERDFRVQGGKALEGGGQNRILFRPPKQVAALPLKRPGTSLPMLPDASALVQVY